MFWLWYWFLLEAEWTAGSSAAWYQIGVYKLFLAMRTLWERNFILERPVVTAESTKWFVIEVKSRLLCCTGWGPLRNKVWPLNEADGSIACRAAGYHCSPLASINYFLYRHPEAASLRYMCNTAMKPNKKTYWAWRLLCCVMWRHVK
jgi:hypothetical protein